MERSKFKKQFILVVPSIMGVCLTLAQQPTWQNGIACIIYTHCSPCHNENGIAPFTLMSYQDALDNLYGIQNDVNKNIMPPYPPDRNYQRYQDERYLSDSEKLAINQWVKKGGPSGNLSKTIAAPVYDYKNVITDPDFTAAIPVYHIPDTITTDLYRCFVISNPFPQSQFVSAIEVIPGNRSAVHHVLVYQDTSNLPVTLDSADQQPGYTMFGGTGSFSSLLVKGWTPGQSGNWTYPANMGTKIAAGSRLVIQIHYPVSSAGKIDSTRISFKYNKGSQVRDVQEQPLLNELSSLVNGPFIIPANKVKTFYEQYKIPAKQNLSLLGIIAHSHLVCASMKAYAVKPTGDTVPLINIPRWDFHWQGAYMFKKMITLPAGTTLYGEAVYNNTIRNPDNPNNPPADVYGGEQTTSEMMQFYFFYTKTLPGDDALVFDTTTRLPMYSDCSFVVKGNKAVNSFLQEQLITKNNDAEYRVAIYPNPVYGKLNLNLGSMEPAKILLYNIDGQLCYKATAHHGNNQFDVEFLSNGYYLLKVSNSKINYTMKFVKQ